MNSEKWCKSLPIVGSILDRPVLRGRPGAYPSSGAGFFRRAWPTGSTGGAPRQSGKKMHRLNPLGHSALVIVFLSFVTTAHAQQATAQQGQQQAQPQSYTDL